MMFLYKEAGDLVLMDQTNYEQVSVSAEMVGEAADPMKDNLPCTVLFFNERAVDVQLPTFRSARGHRERARRARRYERYAPTTATVETGAMIMVPLFIPWGTCSDRSRTHEYVERISK